MTKKLLFSALLSVSLICSCGEPVKINNEVSIPPESTTEKTTQPVTESPQEVTEISTSYSEKEGYHWEGSTLDMHSYVAGIVPQPPLWKVYDPQTDHTLYLMGTIHASCGYTFPLDQTVNEIYENSDGIAVEYNVNDLSKSDQLKKEYFSYMKYSDGTGIQSHLPEQVYKRAKEYLESQGRYTESMEDYNVAYWYNTISALPLSRIDNLSSLGVEGEFIEKAESDGKDVLSIENLQTQADAVAGYSDRLAEYFIESTLSDFSENMIVQNLTINFANTYNFWIIGNDESMLKVFESSFDIPDFLTDDYNEYKDKLLKNRNVHMAETASQLLKEGKNYLFMVGSLHYAGENGVDNLLSEMGYTVEELS